MPSLESIAGQRGLNPEIEGLKACPASRKGCTACARFAENIAVVAIGQADPADPDMVRGVEAVTHNVESTLELDFPAAVLFEPKFTDAISCADRRRVVAATVLEEVDAYVSGDGSYAI